MGVHRSAVGIAAIGVLADEGSRALTHRAVDRRAGVPEGTTSRYARTRAALLELAATAMFTEDLHQAVDASRDQRIAIASTADVTILLVRATRVLLGAPERVRARAELQLEARRVPALHLHFQRARAAFVMPLAMALEQIGQHDPQAHAELLVTTVDAILYRQLVSGFVPLTDQQVHDLITAVVTTVHSRPGVGL